MNIEKTIIIRARPEEVFAAITDFGTYGQWNPWLIKAVGDCRPGADVVVNAYVRGKLQQYHHEILEVSPPYVFHWCDKGWFTIFAYGDRRRVLKPHPEGTEYTVTLNVSGPFEFIVQRFFGKSLEAGMNNETNALKSYLEKNE